MSILSKSVEEIQIHYNLTIITGTLHEDGQTFLFIFYVYVSCIADLY